jgi:phosphate-selective porin OprO and OprP
MAGADARAADQDVARKLEQLQKALEAQQQQINSQSQEIERLKAELNAKASPAPTPPAPEKPAAPAPVPPTLTFDGGRPTFKSADGNSSLSFRGRFQLDAAHYNQDDPGPLASDFRRGSQGTGREVNSARELSDGANFRRAQIGVEGKLASDFNYRLMFEFGGSGTEGPARLHEAWLSYSPFAPMTIQAGAFAPNASLDDATSSDESLFIERASPAELSRGLAGSDGRYSIGFRLHEADWYLSSFFTGGTVADAEIAGEQAALVSRTAFILYTDEDVDLLAGADLTWVFEPADQGSLASGARYPVRFRDRPELRVDSTRLIDTGIINAKSAHATGVEAALRAGSFFFQGEHFWYGAEARTETPAGDPSFSGWYAEAAWTLTGEAHKYNPATASFLAPRPSAPVGSEDGFGAVELAVRFSHVDLNHEEGLTGSAASAGAIRGGEQDIWTFGLNWYLTSNLKTSFNYFLVDVDRLNPAGASDITPPFGTSPATPPDGVQIGQDYDAIAARIHFAF